MGLSPGWYLGAYSHYLTELFPRIAQGLSNAPADELLHTFQALIKVVFLDVGLAIDSYIAHRDELIADLRDYGAAFANLPYGTMVATPDLKVVFANRAFEKLFSFAPNSLRGCPLANVMDVTNITILIDADAETKQRKRKRGGKEGKKEGRKAKGEIARSLVLSCTVFSVVDSTNLFN